jgi:hypothetical protein
VVAEAGRRNHSQIFDLSKENYREKLHKLLSVSGAINSISHRHIVPEIRLRSTVPNIFRNNL